MFISNIDMIKIINSLSISLTHYNYKYKYMNMIIILFKSFSCEDFCEYFIITHLLI